MVFSALAQLAFGTAARRDTVLADIQARAATRPRWGVDVIAAAPVAVATAPGIKTTYPFGIVVALRFVLRTDQEDLLARVQQFASGPRLPLTGAWIALHDCGHDTGTACVEITRRVW